MDRSTVIRRARLDDTHQPVEIWVSVGPDAPGLVQATWVGIVEHSVGGRPPQFEVALFDDAGTWKTGTLGFDTADIALDQAGVLVGEPALIWEVVDLAISDDDSAPPWRIAP